MPPVVIAAGVAAAGSIASSAMQSSAANKAARAQADAAGRANQMQWDMYQQQRADQEPWRQAGARALSGLENADFQRDFTMNDFQHDPGYAFRMAEGQKALERSAAARGGLMSGGTLKAISSYGQDLASNEYQNAYNRFNADRDRRWNRLSSLAGVGQTANSQVASAGQNYANQAGSNMMGAANAQGAAAIASANAWGQGMSGLANAGMGAASMYQQNKWMDQWQHNQNLQAGRDAAKNYWSKD